MPRPKDVTPKLKRTVYIDADVVGAVEIKLYDPVRKRISYGKWSGLITKLLQNWLEEEKK